ncbi:hypothetical protein GWI33_000851 [Rhynchophorus ferrugineus]|uniref:Ku domain-containing protein n=1 Tax=Rhynchophorus ferrugineus TaxID=354439 RepID=A0A834IQS7_RHYFE|nr:hypothetical protein GWI33_000851 [Rhynchophorus ferrugineus]
MSNDECKLYVVNCDKNIFYIDTKNKIDEIISTISELNLGVFSDLLHVLKSGIEELKSLYEKSEIITLQLVLLSDLQSFEITKDDKIEDAIINDLNNYDIFLYIFGPDFKPQQTLYSETDIKKWMKNIDIPEHYGVKSIISNTNHSIICNFDISLHLFNSFKYKKGKQPWCEPLSFGSLLTLPFPTVKLTEYKKPFQLKMDEDKTNTQAKWVYEDKEDVEVNINDTVNGLVLHDTFVKIDSDDASNVPEYLFQNESYLIAPNGKQDEHYLELLYTLIHSMVQLKKYIIAKKVYYANVNPKYVVLIPKLDADFRGFLLCELPYAEDIAYPYYENVTDPPSISISDNINTFLDYLDLNSPTCKLNVPLAPKLMIDTSSMNIVHKVLEIKLNEKMVLNKYDNLVHHGTDKQPLKDSWPIRDIQEVKKEEADDDDFDDISDFNF